MYILQHYTCNVSFHQVAAAEARKIYTAKYGKKQSEPNALDKLLEEVNDDKYIF